MRNLLSITILAVAFVGLVRPATAHYTSQVTIQATQNGAQSVKISTNGGAGTNARLVNSGLTKGQDYFVSGEGTSVITITFDVEIHLDDTFDFKCDITAGEDKDATVHDDPPGWTGV